MGICPRSTSPVFAVFRGMKHWVERRRGWPKGAYPEKYRWRSVEARLEHAWTSEHGQRALSMIDRRGLAAFEALSDPYVRVFETAKPALDCASLRAELRGEPVFIFEWVPPPTVDDDIKLGVVASADPLDAVVAVGVAGPGQGIGTAAVIRFLLALRGHAEFAIDALGEDSIRLSIGPRDDAAALAIAERVLELCKGMARAGASADSLVRRMLSDHTLTLDWRLPCHRGASAPSPID